MEQRSPRFAFAALNAIQGLLLLGCVAILGSCVAPPSEKTTVAPATTTVASTAVAPAPAAPAAPTALPHDQAVMAAAKDLFTKAQLPAGRKYTVVIDPLVDGVTGIQTAATDAMEKQVVQIVKSDFPQYEVKAFSAATVAELPLIMVGTFTPINLQGKPEGEKDAYRVCFALADLKTGLIVSKGFARSQTIGVDSLPKPFFRDSPVWVNDKIVEGYIKTCQGTKAGDPINPAYIDKVVAATTIDEAMRAYNSKHYRDALALYNSVLRTKEGDQPRVNIGIYLARLELGQRQAAMKAFGKIVDYGLSNKRLAVQFGFGSGMTSITSGAPIKDQWLKEIAKQAVRQTSCVEVAGHSSRGGSEALNERLSLQRAEYVRQRLIGQKKELAERLKTQGYGSRQSLIGTGKNDASDSLDRRIEFRPAAC